jgi:hypothetical protein
MLVGGVVKFEVVLHEGNTLNTLFDELSRWEEVLKDTSIRKLDNDPEP